MFLRVTAIIVLGLIAYGAMLPAQFKTMDDRISIVENPLIKSFSHIPEIFREGYFHDQYYYRPMANLSFMAEYQAFGLNSFFYNLANLILHILNALLVFLLASRMTKSSVIGFWTGLLFVIHPVQWEAVCNISGRSILLSALFELATFVLFVEFYKHRRWFLLALALITFFLGLLSKESAGVLPGVLAVYLMYDKTSTWLQKLKDLWPFLGIIALYLLLRLHFGITQLYVTHNPYMLLLSFVTFLRSVITDLRLFILPVDLHFDRCLPFFMSLTYPPAVAALVFWAIVLAALYYWRRRIQPFVLFLMGWFALELLPVSQLITGIGVGAGHVSTAEHFLYLASVPVFIGMVTAFRWFYGLNVRRAFVRPALLKILAGGFLAFLLLTAIEQSLYAVSELGMLERSLAFEGNNPRIQGAMGLLCVFRNDLPSAERHFKAAVMAEPLNPIYHISLGTALCQQGKWIEGLAQYVALDPGNERALVEREEKLTMTHIRRQMSQGKTFDAKGWLTLGIYYAEGGQIQQAIDAFVKSADLNPAQADVWLNLGSLQEARQNWPAARAAYKKLLALHDLTVFQKDFALKHLVTMNNK